MIGKTYSKKDIIEEGFNPDDKPAPRQYDEARKILLKEFPFFDDINKFPASLAFKMISVLKKYS